MIKDKKDTRFNTIHSSSIATRHTVADFSETLTSLADLDYKHLLYYINNLIKYQPLRLNNRGVSLYFKICQI